MKTKIMIVNSYYSPDIVGGAEISTQVLAESLRDEFEVYILTSSNHKEEIINDDINGVKVYRIPNSNLYCALDDYKPNIMSKLYWHYRNLFNKKQKRLINDIITKIQPDIIHTQNLNGIGTYIWELAKKNNCKVIHTLRDYQLSNPTTYGAFNFIIRAINRYRTKNVDYIIGISEYILKEFLKDKFFLNSNSKIIYNTINNQMLTDIKQVKNSAIKVGYFGRIELEKGVRFFLDSMIEMSSMVVSEIIIAGTGTIEKELIREYALDSRVKFLGKLSFEETQEKMAYVDLVIVPSLWPEPFGRVLIESYRQGTPVIATNVGGIPEIMYNKEFIVKPNDKEELKNKVQYVSSLSAEDYNQLSKECKIYSENYINNNKEYIRLYKAVTSSEVVIK